MSEKKFLHDRQFFQTIDAFECFYVDLSFSVCVNWVMKKVLSFVLIFGLEIIGLIGTIIFMVRINLFESDKTAFLYGNGIPIWDFSTLPALSISFAVVAIALPMLLWILNLLTYIFGFNTGRFGRIMNTIKMIFHIIICLGNIYNLIMMSIAGIQGLWVILYIFLILFSVGGIINASVFRNR